MKIYVREIASLTLAMTITMLLSLNWLKEFVEIPKAVSPEKLGQLLSLHTVEVEKVEPQADKYKKVVVGKILEIKPHPKADKLKLALVDVGAEKLEVVCGAPNIEVGQLVPVALVGAALANGAEIKPAEIRGVKSNGMLCAEDELGLGSDHAGIVILGQPPLPPLVRGVKAGQPLADYLKLNDVVFEVDNKSITHRADLWSHYGMARDISAFLDTKFKPVKLTPPTPLVRGEKISVKVEDFKLCPRYLAVGLTGIKVAASPEWLKARLSAAGMRPINNIVDATNYVMLELGQPLHAFDRNFIDKIIVRRAKAGETIETLDGQKRQLEPEMLVIANQAKPVAVAGVMGGANSEINSDTSAIIIESANFNFDSVRKTAQTLALRTESSMRFEKGLDPNLAELGLKRAVELILKICPGARLAGNLVDEKQTPLIPLLKGDGRGLGPIDFSLAWLNQRVGAEFSAKQVKQILEKLGFGVREKAGKFSVTIPSWRAVRDISLAEDVMEEVARIYGFNKITSVMPKAAVATPFLNQEKILERKIKNILSLGARMTEAYNYSFLKSGGAEAIKLVNPLSSDLAFLRTSLLAGLLENIKTNQAHEECIQLYEIGNIFLNRAGENNLPFQEKRLGLVLAAAEGHDLFRELKGVIEYLLKSLDLPVVFESAESGADIFVDGKKIGQALELEKAPARSLGIKKPAAMAEISLPALFSLIKNQPAKVYREPPKYPAAVRDLAFVINEKILYNNIVQLIKNFSDLISQVELFDVYQGDKLGEGKKSLAFHVIYQADRTLTNQAVDELQEKLIKHLEKELGAKIRDF